VTRPCRRMPPSGRSLLRPLQAPRTFKRRVGTQRPETDLRIRLSPQPQRSSCGTPVLRSGSNDFALLSNRRLIPAETRAYVPAVTAASNLFVHDGPVGGSPAQIVRSPAILYAQPTTEPQQ
jgi:hypothetical protein